MLQSPSKWKPKITNICHRQLRVYIVFTTTFHHVYILLRAYTGSTVHNISLISKSSSVCNNWRIFIIINFVMEEQDGKRFLYSNIEVNT